MSIPLRVRCLGARGLVRRLTTPVNSLIHNERYALTGRISAVHCGIEARAEFVVTAFLAGTLTIADIVTSAALVAHIYTRQVT